MLTRFSHVMIYSRRHAEAVNWYCDKLGFEIDYKVRVSIRLRTAKADPDPAAPAVFARRTGCTRQGLSWPSPRQGVNNLLMRSTR